jgi:DNA polymerase-3 subunit alpha
MGLDQVNSLSGITMERIIRNRPFASMEDFLARVDPRQQEAVNLARVGAFEGMGSIPALLQRLEKGGWQARQPGLFDVFSGDATSAKSREGDWTTQQKVAAQKELLGISLEAHPLELAAGRIAAAGAISTVEAAGQVGQKVTVAGIRQSSHRSKTSKGETMMFLTLEDLSGTLDCILFPDVFKRVGNFIYTPEPILVVGTVEMDQERMEPFLRAEKVMKL